MELAGTFVSRVNREALQRALCRGNALMVTAIGVDFVFDPRRSATATCNAVLAAANAWRGPR